MRIYVRILVLINTDAQLLQQMATVVIFQPYVVAKPFTIRMLHGAKGAYFCV